jgi:hypothetical protein
VTLYKDAYSARTAIADALAYLRQDDGWQWDDLRELCEEEIDHLLDEEEAGE